MRNKRTSGNVHAFRRHRDRRVETDWQVYTLAVIVFLAVIGAGLLYTQPQWFLFQKASPVASGLEFICTVSSITDGDTFRCGEGTRIRLSGVAARETDGSCSPGHPCPEASAEAATSALRGIAAGQVLTCRSVGETYGRVAAFCKRQDGVDLSCAMIDTRTVEKWSRYWGFHRC